MAKKVKRVYWSFFVHDWSSGHTEEAYSLVEAKQIYCELCHDAFRFGDHVDADKITVYDDGTYKTEPFFG